MVVALNADVDATLLIARIENSTQFVVPREEGIELIDQQRRPLFINNPID